MWERECVCGESEREEEKKRNRVGVCERVCMCERVRENKRACVFESKWERVCVRERERVG